MVDKNTIFDINPNLLKDYLNNYFNDTMIGIDITSISVKAYMDVNLYVHKNGDYQLITDNRYFNQVIIDLIDSNDNNQKFMYIFDCYGDMSCTCQSVLRYDVPDIYYLIAGLIAGYIINNK